MKISNIIISSKILSYFVCNLLKIKNNSYNRMVAKRMNTNILDYKQHIEPLPKCYNEYCLDNNCFGIGWSIRKYAKWHKSHIDLFCEHGYFYGSFVSEQEVKSYAKSILTFGEVRKKHINKVCNKNVIPIGPYVHYAPDYYDDLTFQKEKKKLGRTLLVFFSHSSTGQTVTFDLDFMIKKIETIRNNFDTVVISLFWSDINDYIINKLESKGYKIFSSGNRFDYLFLSRQKTMIKLSDVTMSNSIGTHIAYCIYYKKAHWLINQKSERKSINKTGEQNMKIAKWQQNDKSGQDERTMIYNMFGKYTNVLTDEQYRFAYDFYGFGFIRSQNELFNILKNN